MPRTAFICGAGPAGMALARLLTNDGWQVTVVERAPGVRSGGYAVDLRGEGMAVADDFYFASACQVHLPSWSSHRVGLLGDAACGAAPTSGMGTTQAFVAARNLASALRDVLEALPEYERLTRPIAERNQAIGVEGAMRFGARP